MERYETDFVGRVTDEAYGDLEYALKRVEQRIAPETKN
jgi:hypothetical protein